MLNVIVAFYSKTQCIKDLTFPTLDSACFSLAEKKMKWFKIRAKISPHSRETDKCC